MTQAQSLAALKVKLNLRYTPDVYINLGTAKFAMEHMGKKCWVIVMGDNCKYWVVCFADAGKLVKAGYEMLPVGA
jgi:hypothetical protein